MRHNYVCNDHLPIICDMYSMMNFISISGAILYCRSTLRYVLAIVWIILDFQFV